nr:hypothetical protein GCM10010200_077130 [Actinomadura rugatobispora]
MFETGLAHPGRGEPDTGAPLDGIGHEFDDDGQDSPWFTRRQAGRYGPPAAGGQGFGAYLTRIRQVRPDQVLAVRANRRAPATRQRAAGARVTAAPTATVPLA